MIKRFIFYVMIFIMAVTGVQAGASEAIGEVLSDLALDAQHYYNTTVAFNDVTIQRVNEDLYEIYYYTPDGKGTTTKFCKTEWGVWNLGDLTYSDQGTEKYVMGGGTDWEYVFRAYNPISQTMEFTGGNHGCESLNYIYFYDSVTGEGFELGVGESKYVNRLVVEEGTTIRVSDKDYLSYANIVRKYTFVGDMINLDCRVEFIRDINMSICYTAMATVNKEFGRYCSFDDKAYVMTSTSGSSTNYRMGNHEALVCTLSGDNPALTVTVGVYDKEDMTDNFSNFDKTFLWDMTDNFNKLYFSKFSLSNATTVKAGTVWNLGTFWKLNIK